MLLRSTRRKSTETKTLQCKCSAFKPDFFPATQPNVLARLKILLSRNFAASGGSPNLWMASQLEFGGLWVYHFYVTTYAYLIGEWRLFRPSCYVVHSQDWKLGTQRSTDLLQCKPRPQWHHLICRVEEKEQWVGEPWLLTAVLLSPSMSPLSAMRNHRTPPDVKNSQQRQS